MSTRTIVFIFVSAVLGIALLFLLLVNSISQDIIDVNETINEALRQTDSLDAKLNALRDSMNQAMDDNSIDSGWHQKGLPGDIAPRTGSDENMWLDSAYR